jgi:hypothetical protein
MDFIQGARAKNLRAFFVFWCNIEIGFGRAENRSGRKSGEESPNSTGRDAA